MDNKVGKLISRGLVSSHISWVTQIPDWCSAGQKFIVHRSKDLCEPVSSRNSLIERFCLRGGSEQNGRHMHPTDVHEDQANCIKEVLW